MFRGPVFIIGMPRSGTKLLRTILDQHPLIGIARYETEFFPYWVRILGKFGDLSLYSNFKKFYFEMLKLPYFLYNDQAGTLIPCHTWFELCDNYTPGGLFEALIRYDIGMRWNEKKIWGDKSPSYLKHMPLLKRHFPEAKFIHIIRDVRDYCLSINSAWGKNMFRAAQRWVDTIETARAQSKGFSQDYFEVRYEDILSSPTATFQSVCSFLGVPFEEVMLKLNVPVENLGDAKGKTYILKNNQGKFESLLPPGKRKKIEGIAGSLLTALGYPVHYQDKISRIPWPYMTVYKLLDGVNLVKSNIRRRGLRDTYRYLRGFLRIS